MAGILSLQTSSFLESLVILYIFLALAHYLIQIIFAHLHHLKILDENEILEPKIIKLNDLDKLPKCSIIFPIHDEDPEILDKVMKYAIRCLQTLKNIELIFVDDGSSNLDKVKPIYDYYQKNYNIIIKYQTNQGKREAQCSGFRASTGEIIITTDSDTLIYSEGILRLIAPLIAFSNVGAVTGDLRVANDSENWLTMLTSLRYWMAFHLERASQSLSGTMTCLSGPFSAYRREVFEAVKEEYINQQFLGKKCTYGDDRHLTNLVITNGYQTIFQEGAIADTYVPSKLSKFYNQQIRWSKSFYREFIWSLGKIRYYSLFSTWDTLSQFLMTFLYLFAFSNVIFRFWATKNWGILVWYSILLIGIALVRSVYGYYRTGKSKFLFFPIYSFLYLIFLVPAKIRALIEFRDVSWGTRGKKKNQLKILVSNYLSFSLYFFLMFGLIQLQKIFYNDYAIATEWSFNFNFNFIKSIMGLVTIWYDVFYPILFITGVFILLLFLRKKNEFPSSFILKPVIAFLLIIFLYFAVENITTVNKNNQILSEIKNPNSKVLGETEKK